MPRNLFQLAGSRGRVRFISEEQGCLRSARIDIPKEDVPPIHAVTDGVHTFGLWDTEWMDVDEVRKFLDESLKGRKGLEEKSYCDRRGNERGFCY